MDSTDSVLEISGVSKRFGEIDANKDISFSLKRGEVLALLGENGAGKTTLMNILFGHYDADAGEIRVNGEALRQGSPAASLAAGIGMVHQHFTLGENLSVLENIELGTEPIFSLFRAPDTVRSKLRALSEKFGIDVNPEASVSTLTVGEQQRVEILKALYRNAAILILDEPTAVLTPQESEQLFDTLKQMVREGLSIIFISHKLSEVYRVADRIAVLRQGGLVGSFDPRETNREALAKAMVGDVVVSPIREPKSAGAPILKLTDVSLTTATGRPLRELSLELREGEILGVAGVSGNGQAALASLLSGEAVPDGGQFTLFGEPVTRADPRVMLENGVGRVPEDRHEIGVIGEMSIPENLFAEHYRDPQFQRAGWLRTARLKDYARRLSEEYDIRGAEHARHAQALSGGNMQKLILARVLSRQPRAIIASQPTRGLDVGATAYVHGKLLDARNRGCGIVLISEDLEEILALSDRVAVIYSGRLDEPQPVEEVSVSDLGLRMTGHSTTEAAAHAS